MERVMSLSWVALNAVKGLGPVRIKQLLELFESPEEAFRQSKAHLTETCGLPRNVADAMHEPGLFEEAERQVRKADEENFTILTLADTRYPALLREIFAPPPVIYCRGSLDVFAMHAVAVVGTRKPTLYGQNAAKIIVEGLARQGFAIISGLALGIDACAHQTCLDNGGKTVAVLGCGVDQLMPMTNRRLGEKILEQGAVISEFPIGTPPEPYNFPRRNRIISGLASGVAVIEAGKKSGALITAHYAVQQGREVFAVPGSIFSERSEGTFSLIASGATPIKNARDVADGLSTLQHYRPSMPPPAGGACSVALSGPESLVIEALDSEPLRIDELAERTQQIVSELFDILLNLELKGLIRQVAGQQYVRI